MGIEKKWSLARQSKTIERVITARRTDHQVDNQCVCHDNCFTHRNKFLEFHAFLSTNILLKGMFNDLHFSDRI